ncbi:ARP2/3 complex 16 kDa subunit (p16-Arc)-domain-containing protein [Endogone sp. FLAS-F59071]|nr:ARP2/3 complex 16 kDa subunit (p16-Arc)-domain-containing protein [Endogone sp. FLAS-F59071]|eukprot:RUS16700.1 ARP2/3 complex 16 kDa subunit (p16-Arc)-domain-containing protein [Endogone sp. FLAS-F59071]
MAFRKDNIDKYDEEVFDEEELLAEYDSGRDPREVEAAVQSKNVDVRGLLQGGDVNGALARALESPPYGRGVDTAKAQNTQIVMEVLNQFRATDVAAAIKVLNTEQRDVLMKYLYAGLAKPELFNSTFNSTLLLNWHKEVCLIHLVTSFHSFHASILRLAGLIVLLTVYYVFIYPADRCRRPWRNRARINGPEDCVLR